MDRMYAVTFAQDDGEQLLRVCVMINKPMSAIQAHEAALKTAEAAGIEAQVTGIIPIDTHVTFH